ncbi:MAG: PQQ-dependent sugar dehydrogenase [Caulobacteraceae bacterium]
MAFAGVAAYAGVSLAQQAESPPAAPGAAPAAAPAPGGAAGAPAPAARRGPAPEPPLGAGPWDLDSQKGKVHVSVVTKGLERPWAVVWLPNGDMLVTERPGRLRVIRKGVLDPVAITGLPPIYNAGLGGLMDIALHPNYAKNHLIYFTYTKEDPNLKDQSTLVLGRAKWDGGPALTEFKELFVADMWYGHPPLPTRCCGQGPATGSYGSRIQFDKAGKLFMTSGDRNYGEMVHDQSNDWGKLYRFNDDGSIPKDNPFVGQAGHKPEIWTTGHRNGEGLFYDAVTGKLWESEFGPRGGDEVNLIEKGKNYGWIEVTQGAHYNGEPAKGIKNVPGVVDPVLTWPAPSTNPGNLIIYHADKFPQWKGDLLMGTMSRSLLRASFDAQGNVTGQERFLTELKQRFRDTRVGPDGDLYLLTDEPEGALLKVEPGK